MNVKAIAAAGLLIVGAGAIAVPMLGLSLSSSSSATTYRTSTATTTTVQSDGGRQRQPRRCDGLRPRLRLNAAGNVRDRDLLVVHHGRRVSRFVLLDREHAFDVRRGGYRHLARDRRQRRGRRHRERGRRACRRGRHERPAGRPARRGQPRRRQGPAQDGHRRRHVRLAGRREEPAQRARRPSFRTHVPSYSSTVSQNNLQLKNAKQALSAAKDQYAADKKANAPRADPLAGSRRPSRPPSRAWPRPSSRSQSATARRRTRSPARSTSLADREPQLQAPLPTAASDATLVADDVAIAEAEQALARCGGRARHRHAGRPDRRPGHRRQRRGG